MVFHRRVLARFGAGTQHTFGDHPEDQKPDPAGLARDQPIDLHLTDHLQVNFDMAAGPRLDNVEQGPRDS
jgi:hypothetical protein